MYKSIRTGLAGIAVIAAGALIATPGHADETADVYKDRTVTILVGYGAGGTYGQTSLLLARHFGKKIPGKPTVIVQHMPGAGGLKMTNYAYNAAPQNGTYVMMPPEMSVVSQLLRPKKIKFVTSKFTWLGRVFGANQVMMVRRDTGIKSLADLTKREIIVASTGTGSPTFLVPKMMNALLGTRFKSVTGYKASAKTSHSVEQGETFGMSNSWASWKKNRTAWFTGKPDSFALVLTQIGYEREPDLPNVPLLSELAKGADDKAVATMLSTSSVIGRGLAFVPNVPRKLIEPVRAAFWATVTSAEFKADAKKRLLPVTPLKGVDIQKIVNDALQMSPRAVAKARKYIFGK